MNCSFMNTSFVPKALPSLPLPLLHGKVQISSIQQKASKGINLKAIERLVSSKSSLAIQVGTLLTTVGAEPALAVTGVNNEEDLIWALTQLAISAFFYFLVCPPIIMTWLRKRWYKRDLLEMYLQFMFVFIFFPGTQSLEKLISHFASLSTVASRPLIASQVINWCLGKGSDPVVILFHGTIGHCGINDMVLLWAPFLNFRKFPRDPSMKYPWSTPENPSQVKNMYRKYPWATEEDYEVL